MKSTAVDQGLSRTQVDGQTKLVGLLGRGIAHTLSPTIHNSTIAALGLNCLYVPFDIQGEFPSADFFQTMWKAGALGFNVTVPFKEDAARRFPTDEVSVNTIYRGPEGFLASSTDAQGFIRGLKELGHGLNDFEAIIILGHGGAAKALLQKFRILVPKIPLIVLKRSTTSADMGSDIEYLPFEPGALEASLRTFPSSLLIQSTSAPLQGDDLRIFAPALKALRGAFIDLVYGKPSALWHAAKSTGIPSQDGIPMLIGQALLAQELWWGQSAPSFSSIEQQLRLLLASRSL